ncbi:dual specificity protein phosphatase 18 [Scaptodrosophila lebanonensis]|uniref:Dual specificity protein phosphatase 18 n=1 Tax=Drosophila lebanonensis TaxID=7225 RepID=A0A6J2T7P6_DROLE|nr:dual specificity protein phosphatase 18 [Scaptodrosophila lebanonensis]
MQVLIAESNMANSFAAEDLTSTSRIKINSSYKEHGCIRKQSSVTHSKAGSEQTFPGVSRLTPTLYLCGAAAVPEQLGQLGVRLVVNVAPELPDTPLPRDDPPLYLRINVQDRSEVDFLKYFNEVADLIEEVRRTGGSSLVHCVAGVSRSASLCLAYLMKHGGMSLRDAYTHVKSIRPQVRPNSGFFQQLREFEVQLRGVSSVEMIYFASLDKEIPDVLEPEYRSMEDFYKRYRNALKKR